MRQAEGEKQEILREDGELVLIRLRSVNGPIASSLVATAASDPPSRSALARLDREYALRDRLDAGWAAVPLDLHHELGRPRLRLSDPGGECLSQLIGQPWALRPFLSVAIGLARALCGLHGRGLVHQDIRPANVLADLAGGRVWLTGLGTATEAPEPSEAPGACTSLSGTLAYLAPEQTGRMNRAVDARSDLYACGISFYEMLTGTLPFTPASAMEAVHCHLAKQPLAPQQRTAGIPRLLSDLVMKLLAKSPEERYQSAAGLKADLRRALDSLDADGAIGIFTLGLEDLPARMRVPERLFGREQDLETLRAAYERVRSSGRAEWVLVSGYSGVGKSSLVNQLRRSIAAQNPFFATGKFDQFKRDIPYASIAGALQSLVRSILGEEAERLAGWRKAILAALGTQGQLLITLVPDLELVIGSQPAVAELPAQAARQRILRVLRAFLGVFARTEHPLVLFLDDLQWLDHATLELLAELLDGPSPGHLLLIGAYRDNEVGAQHPLTRTLSSLRGSGAIAQELALEPLGVDDVAALIAATLCCETRRVLPLAHLVHERTRGNPFFAIQFLNLVADEGLLRFDPATACWNWDPRRIASKASTDNVVGLMVERLARLPAPTQDLLKTFACLGSEVRTGTLGHVLDEAGLSLHDTLWSAVQAGLVTPLGEVYAFLHDRVQEAAYALIPEDQRAKLHLRIARRLADGTPRAQLEENIFEIANQFDRAAGAIRDPEEALRVAEFNRIAGNRARRASAYATAQAYFSAGLRVLPDHAAGTHYDLVFELRFRQAQCEFLTGQSATAAERLEALSHYARGLADVAAVTCLRVDLHTSLRRSDLAVDVCLAYLRRVGIDWSAHPTREEAAREFRQISLQIGGRSIEELIDLPLMTDADSQATLDVLTSVQPPALFTDEHLHSLVVGRMANLSLAKGNSDGSCYAYAVLGVVLGAALDDYASGFRFGKLGHDLVEHRGLTRFKARAYMSFGAHVNTWSRPLHASLHLVRQAHACAQESGDLSFSAYSWETIITLLLASGTALGEVQREAEAGLEFAQRMRVGLVADIITGQLGLIRSLRGLTRRFGSFDDETFEALAFEQRLDDSMLAFAACWYWIRKLQAAFHAGDWPTALDAASRARTLTWTSPGHFELAEYHFYSALALARQHDGVVSAVPVACMEQIRSHLRQLEIWAGHCPETFEARTTLVAAEAARIEGRELDAQGLYERSIRAASRQGGVHIEALACELAGLHYAERGYELSAQAYLRRARYAYQRWGADGKVRQLEALHPQMCDTRGAASVALGMDPSVEHLDLATVLKVSQAISGEIDPGRLIDTLMVTALENAGAAMGLLILPRGDGLQLAAEARADRDRVQVHRNGGAPGPANLPLSMLHYTVRTLEAVAIDDAADVHDFQHDSYFANRRARSVLCLPLVKQSTLIGVLYLENPLASGVFTAGRLAVLKLLASQAAIALENALLFEVRERTEAALRVTEARYLLADSAGCGHTDWVVASDEFYGSPRFLEICGLPADTRFSGREGFLAVLPLHPEDREQVIHELDAQLRSGIPRLEKELRMRVRGDTRWVHLSSVFQHDRSGALQRVIGSYTDVTGRKRAELAQRASEERFEIAIAGSSQGVFDWDMKTDQLFLSRRAQLVLGLEPGDPWRSRPEWLARFRQHPDDHPDYLQALKSHLSNQTPAYDAEYRLIQPDGSVRWYRHRGVALRDATGTPFRMAGSIEDISDRKFAEEELRRLEKQRRQSQRLEAMGTLAGGIAHDFNNILGAVLGYGEMALRDAPLGSRLRRDLDSIMVAGERGRALVDRILAFSRSGIGERVAVNVGAVVGEALDLLAVRLPENVRIERQIHTGRAALLGDATEVHQVMMNLGTNALQAMPNGGTLAVRLHRQLLDQPRIASTATLAPGEYLRLQVSDTGTGMAPELIERIFDPFFTTRDAAAGTGLGLSLVHSIVKEVGGAVEVTSAPGSGSLFTVWFPRAGDARLPTPPDSRSPLPGNGEQILIVDDEEALLRLACESLAELGYETRGFTSAIAALEAFSAEPERFDALITDERMPGLSGTALIGKVRELRATLPVMLISGYAGRLVARRAREAGADEVLNKPLSRRELAAALQRVLEPR